MTNRKPTRDDFELFDWKMAATRVAGTLTVALASGAPIGTCEIYQNRAEDEWKTVTWSYRYNFLRGGETPLLAIASTVAWMLHGDERIADSPVPDNKDWGITCRLWFEDDGYEREETAYWEQEAERASDEERTLMPRNPETLQRTIVEAIRLLVTHQVFFRWAIMQLLEHYKLTDGDARRQWEAQR